MSSKVLIVSFFFPPSRKVGGRRWAKLAKYLVRNGVEVHVLAVETDEAKENPWGEDIEEFASNITYLPAITKSFYKRNIAPTTILGKIRYRIGRAHEKRKHSRYIGNHLDVSIPYVPRLIREASRIIKQHKIQNLIVTGGPFRIMHVGALLKRKCFPNLNLIADYRDFWYGSINNVSFSQDRLKSETQKEKEVLEQANTVFAVNDMIVNRITEKFDYSRKNIVVLPHVFDHDDFVKQKMESPTSGSNAIRLVYAGTLYNKMEIAIQKLCVLMLQFKTNGVEPHLDFYTFDQKYRSVFEQNDLTDHVSYNGLLPAKVLFQKMSTCDILLQLRASQEYEQHFKSSKFFELIMLKRPIVYIGIKSELSEYVVDNQLGYSFDEDGQEVKLVQEILENRLTGIIPQPFNMDAFSFKEQVKEVITFIR